MPQIAIIMTLMQSYSDRQKSKLRNVGQHYQSFVMMGLISLVLFGGIVWRLAYLQLIEGHRFRAVADENRIRLIAKQPARGNIFDRKGRIMATSRLSKALFVWPRSHSEEEWKPILKRISEILNIPEAELSRQIERAENGYNSTQQIRIARSLTAEQATLIGEFSNELPGVDVEYEALRYYPNGTLAAHVLGYTGEVDETSLAQLKPKGYRLGDIIGQLGIEAGLEHKLRGKWGGQQVEVDNTGQIVRSLGEEPAQAGQDITLTIDLDIQRAAEKALGNTQGAIVVMDPNDGAILAMVSRPVYDPNVFSQPVTEEIWQQIQGSDHPFVNRALRGFPPASTFKIITTVAALKSGKFDPYTVLPTYPYIIAGGIQFWDWNQAGFGPLGFDGAMAWSSDTFFYQVGLTIGGPTLIEWTRRFSFGSKTGIELAAEEDPGLVADDAWKRKYMNEEWFEGDTVNMSIGQGFLLATPLQVALMNAVPANGGYLVQPHLLKDNPEAKKNRRSIGLSKEAIEVLRSGLRQVVTSGTGQVMNVPTIPPNAGKTGTAEDPPRLSHAWYGGYAPYDKPEIVVVVFGENSGGGGGGFAAPKALQVMEDYFKMKQGKK